MDTPFDTITNILVYYSVFIIFFILGSFYKTVLSPNLEEDIQTDSSIHYEESFNPALSDLLEFCDILGILPQIRYSIHAIYRVLSDLILSILFLFVTILVFMLYLHIIGYFYKRDYNLEQICNK